MNHVSPSSDNSFLATIKPHIGSLLTGVGSLGMDAVFAYGTFQHNSGASDMQTKDIERQTEQNQQQIKNLQDQLNKEGSVVAVIGQFKEDTTRRLDRIESLLLRDIHLNQQPSH
jgi:hypothetical protein